MSELPHTGILKIEAPNSRSDSELRGVTTLRENIALWYTACVESLMVGWHRN